MTEHHRFKEFTRTSHPIQLSNSFCRFSSTAFNHTDRSPSSQAEKQNFFAENLRSVPRLGSLQPIRHRPAELVGRYDLPCITRGRGERRHYSHSPSRCGTRMIVVPIIPRNRSFTKNLSPDHTRLPEHPHTIYVPWAV
jgi:hypothetical protein